MRASSDPSAIDYSVGHSTITYIIKGMTPTVAWTGDSWRADDFQMDVEAVLGESSGPSDNEGIPGMTTGLAALSARFGGGCNRPTKAGKRVKPCKGSSRKRYDGVVPPLGLLQRSHSPVLRWT